VTTLAILKARIGSEIRRPALTTQIADAITSAITALEDRRYLFDETRTVSFSTVAGQEFYTQADSAFIPRLQKIDYIKILIGGQMRPVYPEAPACIEEMNYNGTQQGEPVVYCYYGEQLRFGYVPSDVWTIRIGGVIRMPAPASDSEADNPWMTKAERAVRCRAKYELYEHVLLNPEMAAHFNPENEDGPTFEAFAQLRRRANNLQGGDFVMEASEW